MASSKCYHCGNESNIQILQDHHNFCCYACKNVYLLLKDNNLDNYYELEAHPGVKKNLDEAYYDFLIPEAIQKELCIFYSPELSKIQIHLPAIHCTSCVWLLENLHKLDPGVLEVQVNFSQQNALITFNPEKTHLKSIAELLHKIGYTPVFEQSNSKENPVKQRKLWYQIAVAGFIFGNVMLLSFPEYLGLSQSAYAHYLPLISKLNFLLSLGIFYSAWDYLKSAYTAIKERQINLDIPISLGILTLWLRSTLDIFLYNEPGFLDSLAGLIFFLLIGKWFQNLSYRQLSYDRNYEHYFPLAVLKKQADGQYQPESIKQLQRGDQIRIRNQELIPVDARVLSNKATADYSFVSGESANMYFAERDLMYAGGRVLNQSVELMVEAPLNESYLVQLWNQKIFQKQNNNSFNNLIDQFSKYFIYGIIGISFITAILWYFIDPSQIWTVVSAVLIVACPCALALARPFSLGNMAYHLSKKTFFAKNVDVIEQMSQVEHIVLDKTGTLSHGHFKNAHWHGSPLTAEEENVLCHALLNSSHPISQSILQTLKYTNPIELSSYEEHIGKGQEAVFENTKIQLGSSSYLNESLPSSAVGLKINGNLRGYYQLDSAFRPQVQGLLSRLNKDYQVHVLSGDNDKDLPFFQELMKGGIQVHFNQKPDNKVSYIEGLPGKVLMIGDGLNDSAALQTAYVGLAVNEQGMNFFPSADGLIGGDHITNLDYLLKASKKAVRFTKFLLVISLLYNIVGLSLAISGQLSPISSAILMPISSLSVVILAFIGARPAVKNT